MKTVVFTSAAINYLPKVRKLCASIRQHHPEWEIVLALAMIAVMILKPGGLFPNREIGHILTRARRKKETAP